MAASIQTRLVEYVKRGGKLLLAPVIPELDDNFQPCAILKDFLEGAVSERFDNVDKYVQAGPFGPVHASEGLWLAAQMPDGAEPLAQETGNGRTAAWKMTYPNGGAVLWFGMPWKFTKYTQMDILRYLLGELDCRQPVIQCDNPNVWTVVRNGGGRRMLFIMNLFSSPMEAGIRIRSTDGHGEEDLGRFVLKPMEVKAVALTAN
uniref:hypothetical protein n=1 Tax=Paenibacillus cymbidii TaxID=1639034 RepID=UPI00108087A7|nr:hypothetical protein [Paenibacillus cymbidii]